MGQQYIYPKKYKGNIRGKRKECKGMKKAIKNSGTIREKNLRIEILDYINVHLSDEVEVKSKRLIT